MSSKSAPRDAELDLQSKNVPDRKYLTRSQVAQLYPISVHTLAKLAARGRGPRFFKPIDKCIYLPEDVEAWIEAYAIVPSSPSISTNGEAPSQTAPNKHGRGRARPPMPPTNPANARKSLPPSPNSWLRRKEKE